MKSILTLLLLSLLALLTLADEYATALACGAKNPKANAAISAFCQKRNLLGALANDLTVPSAYARAGKSGKGGGVQAVIRGNCNPPQWVPITYCLSQFQDMCAKATNAMGWNKRSYGKGGCQTWRIEKVKSGGKKKAVGKGGKKGKGVRLGAKGY